MNDPVEGTQGPGQEGPGQGGGSPGCTDHFGLEKVKERILEYLAVQQRTNKLKGPILCLVGPPGVGKTSLGKLDRPATGREFVRMSLGGVRDEAEIRGHRRTYIGSMPGKVIQSMKKAKKSNPLFLLDEIDKLGADFRGDPVIGACSRCSIRSRTHLQRPLSGGRLRPVQRDVRHHGQHAQHSRRPLMDRMEIIRIAGYTEDEKVEIARRHLIPKQVKATTASRRTSGRSTMAALKDMIRRYTREAGVRNLERELAKLTRKAVKEILTTKKTKIKSPRRTCKSSAGVPKYRFGEAESEDQVGVSSPGWPGPRSAASCSRSKAS